MAPRKKEQKPRDANKEEVVGVRMSPHDLAVIKKLTHGTEMTVSGWIRTAIKEKLASSPAVDIPAPRRSRKRVLGTPGRKKSYDPKRIAQLIKEGHSAAEIAFLLGIPKPTVYRAIREVRG